MPGIEIGSRCLGEDDFSAPIEDRYFEDYSVGAVYEYGYSTASEQEIIAFAEQFDPQPIHTDPAFAATGPFAGIIASGWHSAALLMRLFADHYLSRVASLASPGGDELRWAVPLRPGDQLRLRTTTLEARPSGSKPDRGIVRTHAQLLNQHDECPVSIQAVNILRRR